MRLFKRLKPLEMELSTRSCIILRFKLNDLVQIEPGQFILLQCENLSNLEWHPFTVVDCVSFYSDKRTKLTEIIFRSTNKREQSSHWPFHLGAIGQVSFTERFLTSSDFRKKEDEADVHPDAELFLESSNSILTVLSHRL